MRTTKIVIQDSWSPGRDGSQYSVTKFGYYAVKAWTGTPRILDAGDRCGIVQLVLSSGGFEFGRNPTPFTTKNILLTEFV